MRWFSAFAILAVFCYAFVFVRVLRWKKIKTTRIYSGKAAVQGLMKEKYSRNAKVYFR